MKVVGLVAAVVLAVSACGGEEPVAPAATPPPATSAAPTSLSPTPVTTAPAPPPSTSTGRSTPADSRPGCGQRAVDAGKFNPQCPEYQGYLDPGGPGRGDTSGDLQREYACEQGYLPESEC